MEGTNHIIGNAIPIETIIIDSNQDDDYSNEQDCKIIEFFNNNMGYLEFRNEEDVYQMLQHQYLHSKTINSLKDRFLNTVLPTLYKYPVLSYSRMILFYDKAGLEIPVGLQNLLREKIENQISIVEDTSSEHSSPKSSVDNARQNLSGYNNFEISSVAKQICISINNVQHVFLSVMQPDIKGIKKRLIQEHGILNSNLHVMQEPLFKNLKFFKNHNQTFKNELIATINQFLQLSESIDVESGSKNEQLSSIVVDLDKTKTAKNAKSVKNHEAKNVDLSKIFCLSILPQIEEQTSAKVSENPAIKLLPATSKNVNNIIIEQLPISFKQIDKQECLKQINTERKKQEPAVKSLEKPVSLLVNSGSKNENNHSINLARIGEDKERVKNLDKPIVLGVNLKPENINNRPTKDSHVGENKIVNGLEKLIVPFADSGSESVDNLPLKHLQIEKNNNRFKKQIVFKKSKYIDKPSLQNNDEQEILDSITELIGSFRNSKTKNTNNLPTERSPHFDDNKKQDTPEHFVKKLQLCWIETSRKRQNSKQMINNTESNEKPLLNNVTSQHSTNLNLPSCSTNSESDLKDKPFKKGKNKPYSKIISNSTNYNSDLDDVPLNIRKIKRRCKTSTSTNKRVSERISNDTNYYSDLDDDDVPLSILKQRCKTLSNSTNSDLEDVSGNNRKNKQYFKTISNNLNHYSDQETTQTAQKITCIINYYSDDEIIPRKKRKKNRFEEAKSSCTNSDTGEEDVSLNGLIKQRCPIDQEGVFLKKRKNKRRSISEIVSNISTDHCYFNVGDEKNITNGKTTTNFAQKDFLEILSSEIIPDFSLNPEKDKMGSSEGVISLAEISTSRTSFPEMEVNLLSLYGPTELEIIERDISKMWMSKKYQFSKRLMALIKLNSLNIDHLRIRLAEPVKIKTEL